MDTTRQVGQLVYWGDDLVKIIAINEGSRKTVQQYDAPSFDMFPVLFTVCRLSDGTNIQLQGDVFHDKPESVLKREALPEWARIDSE